MSDTRTERLIKAALLVGALNREDEQIRPLTNGAVDAWHELEQAAAEYDGTSVTCADCGVITLPQYAEFCIGEESIGQPDFYVCARCAEK